MRFVFLLIIAATWLRAQTGAGEDAYKAGVQSLNQGDYAKALQQASQAAREFQAAGRPERLGFAANLSGLAHMNRGEYDAALPFFLDAIRLARANGDRSAEVVRLNNLGNLRFFRGQYSQAQRQYEAALDVLSQAPQGTPWLAGRRQLTLHNLAALYERLGQDRRALDLFKQIRARPVSLAAPEQAQALTNIGVAYRRLGDPYKALEMYGAADRLLAQAPDSMAAMHVLQNTGIVQALDLRDYVAAVRTFERGLQAARANASDRQEVLSHLLLGETRLRMQRPAEARADFEAALKIAERRQLSDELWTALYGVGRVQAATGEPDGARASFRKAVAIIESMRADMGQASLKTEFLAGKRDVYDALIESLLDLPVPDVSGVLRLMEQSRARNLRDAVMGERAPPPSLVSAEEAQARIPPDTAILNYWCGRGRVAVIWITRRGSGIVQRRMADDALEQVERFRRAAADPASVEWEALAAPVSRMLLGAGLPLDSDGALRRVVLEPDGPLSLVPFELLRSGAGGNGPLLVERFDVWHAPSLELALASAKTSRWRRWPWQTQIVAFADPLPASASASLPADARRPRLPASAEEVRAIAQLLPGRSQLYVGAENLKSRLIESRRPGAAALHFATHAVIDRVDARRSRLIFSPGKGADDSAYLFARELEQLDLHEVNLVTLAACSTEAGQMVSGEGLDSFSRAFLARGAGATVSSLWKVSDHSTAEFMKQFYFHLGQGVGLAESLRRAKLAFIRSGGVAAHPHHWAAFVLNGDGAAALPRVWAWPQLMAVLALALAAAGSVWRRAS